MTSRPALCAGLAVILAVQPACVGELQERCPLLTDHLAAPALPRDFLQLDELLRHRALQMWHDARQLNGSATRSFRISFGEETLPLICGRLEQARSLAVAGRADAAGRKYQALLVLSQLVELAIAVHATVEYADQVKELSLTLARTQETFGNQMTPLLEAALSEEPRRIEAALRQTAPAIQAWLQYLDRWTAHIRADAERMVVAKAAWDLTIGAIAAYETAGALAEVVAGGGPPQLPMPALGGGAAAMELSGTAYLELAEAIRRLIASGALDAGVVASLSAVGGGRSAAVSEGGPTKAAGAERAQRHGKNWPRASLRETVARIAGAEPSVTSTETGKIIYANPKTGLQVVYDQAGNYFRVEDPAAKGAARYLDQFGKPVPPNVPVVGPNGTTMAGVPSEVRNAVTHFLNSD